MASIIEEDLEQWGLGQLKVVGLEFSEVFPSNRYCVPLADIDSCFGEYGQAITNDGQPSELQRVCWNDGHSSWCTHRWTPAHGGKALMVTIYTLSGTPLVRLMRV